MAVVGVSVMLALMWADDARAALIASRQSTSGEGV
jgi:hypothetical protein